MYEDYDYDLDDCNIDYFCKDCHEIFDYPTSDDRCPNCGSTNYEEGYNA